MRSCSNATGAPSIVIDLAKFGQQRPPPPEGVAEAEQLTAKIDP
jgi:hypothetical protein